MNSYLKYHQITPTALNGCHTCGMGNADNQPLTKELIAKTIFEIQEEINRLDRKISGRGIWASAEKAQKNNLLQVISQLQQKYKEIEEKEKQQAVQPPAPTVQPTPSPAPAVVPIPAVQPSPKPTKEEPKKPTPQKKDNTLLYAGLAVGGIVVFGTIVYFLKK